ncbi:TonB-dependent siderophore receptor [Paraglaciecola sp. MB-3u-78]|uniref:TonB-dependent receptor plug domain-containing protein n=1 Tax=Paraglaciecola sp. MB-3u-78 TaxID=2058332 RepID=UPI000C33BF69|nr:TonB-dependent receptor [Paraglaciecola sp. MB-3u-78]PKG99362.1 TonB-dependent receptor [Paraglaciecola sp. MB-3u-78]
MNLVVQVALPALLFSVSAFSSASDEPDNSNEVKYVEKITVEGSATANDKPVGTFGSPISNLEYDPRVDLQSRNMAEAQADVTIRGGIFENTGFRVGSATLFDPQTGHYFAEIPIAQEMLSNASVMTGVDNAHLGVNSSVGTVSRYWTPIKTSGSVSIGAGNNNFNLQRIHSGVTLALDDVNDWTIGFEGELSRSESDGTIENGDHQFQRVSGRIQLVGPSSQTDLFLGVQEKFFGWPNMYTPFNVNETEDTKARLLIFNHKQQYAQDSTFEVSTYYRRHNDHYIFSRENPDTFQAFHETEVKSIALSGRHGKTASFALNYSAQFITDGIESTSLENNFTTRRYYKFSVLPEYQIDLKNDQQLTYRLGAAFDDTNRDSSETSLIGDITLNTINADDTYQTVYLSYAQASQVPGYTAIGGSNSSGLFRSNYDLERETTKNIELGLALDHDTWRLDSAIFYRQDNDLTDWTYNLSSTTARTANPVDIKTLGLELLAIKRFDNTEIITSYTFLKKSEDYGTADIDASFYALNYPDHRVTLGVIWHPTDMVEVRVDNEWRKQEENTLRNGADDALFTHLTLKITPSQFKGLDIMLAADNLWDESFEEIPGTPGRGEQYTISATYHW